MDSESLRTLRNTLRVAEDSGGYFRSKPWKAPGWARRSLRDLVREDAEREAELLQYSRFEWLRSMAGKERTDEERTTLSGTAGVGR